MTSSNSNYIKVYTRNVDDTSKHIIQIYLADRQRGHVAICEVPTAYEWKTVLCRTVTIKIDKKIYVISKCDRYNIIITTYISVLASSRRWQWRKWGWRLTHQISHLNACNLSTCCIALYIKNNRKYKSVLGQSVKINVNEESWPLRKISHLLYSNKFRPGSKGRKRMLAHTHPNMYAYRFSNFIPG